MYHKRMHRKHLKHPETMDRGQKKLYLAHMILSTASEPGSVVPSTTSPSSTLPWWKKYFSCFSRRRNGTVSNDCTQTTTENVAGVGTGGKNIRYRKFKNKTKKRKQKKYTNIEYYYG